MRHASKALRKPLEFKTDHRRSAHQIEAKSLIDKPTRDLMLSIGDKLFGAPEKAAAQATHDHGVGFDARGRALNGAARMDRALAATLFPSLRCIRPFAIPTAARREQPPWPQVAAWASADDARTAPADPLVLGPNDSHRPP